MAIIRKRMEQKDTPPSKNETETRGTYQVTKDGLKVRALSSPNSENPEHTSRIIYFQGEALEQLREILSKPK